MWDASGDFQALDYGRTFGNDSLCGLSLVFLKAQIGTVSRLGIPQNYKDESRVRPRVMATGPSCLTFFSATLQLFLLERSVGRERRGSGALCR